MNQHVSGLGAYYNDPVVQPILATSGLGEEPAGEGEKKPDYACYAIAALLAAGGAYLGYRLVKR